MLSHVWVLNIEMDQRVLIIPCYIQVFIDHVQAIALVVTS